MKQCTVSKYDCAARVSKCRAFVDLVSTANKDTLKQVLTYFHRCGEENGLDFSPLSQVPDSVTRKYIQSSKDFTYSRGQK